MSGLQSYLYGQFTLQLEPAAWRWAQGAWAISCYNAVLMFGTYFEISFINKDIPPFRRLPPSPSRSTPSVGVGRQCERAGAGDVGAPGEARRRHPPRQQRLHAEARPSQEPRAASPTSPNSPPLTMG